MPTGWFSAPWRSWTRPAPRRSFPAKWHHSTSRGRSRSLHGLGHGTVSHNESEQRRALLLPQEFKELGSERLVVIAEPDIAPGDCRIEWADGGVVRNAAKSDIAIGNAIGRYLGARPAAMPDLGEIAQNLRTQDNQHDSQQVTEQESAHEA